MSGAELPEVFGYKELAQYLGISRSHAYTIAQQEGFPVIALSPHVHRIYRAAFMRWMEEQAARKMARR